MKDLKNPQNLSAPSLWTESESSESSREDGCCGFLRHRTRYIVLVLACLCLSSTLSNMLTLSFTIICMGDDDAELNHTLFLQNDTPLGELEDELVNFMTHGVKVPEHTKYTYSAAEKNWLFSSTAIGALASVYPILYTLNHFGPRKLFSLVGFVSAISTALIPIAAETYGVWAMCICRGFQGFGLAASLPVIGAVTSHWSTLKQNAFFIAILSSFLQIAPMFTMPVSGALCVSPLGWQSVFYVHAVVTVVLFATFVYFYRDAPRKHSFVSVRELSKIDLGKEFTAGAKRPTTPYARILASAPIWCIWVAAFGNFMGTQLTLQYTPIYLNKVLGITVERVGQVAAIPPLLMFFVKLAAGLTSDRITFMKEKTKLRVYNTIALGGMAVFFVGLAFVPTAETLVCVVLLILASCSLGFNSGGFFKSAQLVARHHSPFVMGNVSMINCLCMLFVPFLVDLLIPNDSAEEWSRIFLIHAGILAVSNLVFCIFVCYKPAVWTRSHTRADAISPESVQTTVVSMADEKPRTPAKLIFVLDPETLDEEEPKI